MLQGPHLRKYGVQTTVDFVLYEVDGVDFRVDAADGGSDCSIMKDEGAEATCTNDFTDEGKGYSIVLTATEMQAARITVYIVDSATKVWLDTGFIVETYGHASAMHAFDLDDAVRGGMTALPNAAADAAGGLPISDAGGLDLDAKLANTNEITAARMGALTDWINGGRLDLLLDAIPTTAMRGTDNAATEAKQDIIDTNVDTLITRITAAVATATALATAQADLDTITGADGVTLATAQGLYAPNKVVPDAAGTAPTAAEIKTAIEAAGSHLALIKAVTDAQAADGSGLTALGDTRIAELAAANLPADIDTLLTRITAGVALASVCTEARLAELDAANLPTDIAAVKTDTGNILGDTNELQTDWHDGGRLDLILDAILSMLDDARSEPGDAALPVNPDAMTKLDYLYKFMRNKIETTSTRIHVYDDAGTNKDHSSIISDDGTTFSRGEFAAGDA